MWHYIESIYYWLHFQSQPKMWYLPLALNLTCSTRPPWTKAKRPKSSWSIWAVQSKFENCGKSTFHLPMDWSVCWTQLIPSDFKSSKVNSKRFLQIEMFKANRCYCKWIWIFIFGPNNIGHDPSDTFNESLSYIKIIVIISLFLF